MENIIGVGQDQREGERKGQILKGQRGGKAPVRQQRGTAAEDDRQHGGGEHIDDPGGDGEGIGEVPAPYGLPADFLQDGDGQERRGE